MGFSNFANTKELLDAKQKTTGGGKRGKRGAVDVSTPEGLRAFAESKGVETGEKEPGFFARGIKTGTDILLVGERFSASILQRAKGVPEDQIDNTLSPSDVIFGKPEESKSFGESLKRQFTTFDGLKRLAVDIALDPLTYVTLGVGSAIKVALKGGAKIALEQSGKVMLRELADEIVQKGISRRMATISAKEQVASLATPTALGLIERGGIKNIQQALIKVGRKPTAVEIKKVLQEGIPELIRKPAVRFAGKKIAPLPKFGKLASGIGDAVSKVPAFRPLAQGLENGSKAFGRLFIRDFNLPKEFIPVKQKFIDSFDASASRIKKDLQLVFSGTTKDQRIAIGNAIDKGLIHTLPAAERKLAKRTHKIFAAVAREEEKRGLLDITMVDYLPHIYKNQKKAKAIIGALREGQPSALLRFNKTRLIQDIETAKALGLDPIEDVAELLNLRLLASERAKLTQDFTKKVGTKFGTKNPDIRKHLISNGEILTRMSDSVVGAPREFKNLFIPQNIADDMSKMGKKFFADEDVTGMLRGYDKVNNFWKGSVTVLFPAFHFRNGISNVALSFLDIGVQAFNPARHAEIVKIFSGADGAIATQLGETITYKEIRRQAKSNQVFQDTLARTDVGRILQKNILKKNIASTGFDFGRKVGRMIENEARMVNYVTNLRRGMDFTDAADRTKQFLFDYDNLSMFEKDIMRRLIPFYTFTRKNIAVQLKGIATQPGRQAAQLKMFNTLSDMFGVQPTPEEERFTPEWIQQSLNIMIQRDGDDRTFLVGFDLPLEDLFEKTTDLVSNPFLAGLNLLSPFIKAPLEAGTGFNFFKQKRLSEDDSGNFAKNLPTPLKDFLEFTSKEVTTKEGKTFDLMKVDPTKKFIFSNVSNFLGLGRLSSGTTINGMVSLHTAFKGEDMSLQDKFDIIRLFTAFSTQTRSLESERKAIEKKESERITAELERKGEIGVFERAFVPSRGGRGQRR